MFTFSQRGVFLPACKVLACLLPTLLCNITTASPLYSLHVSLIDTGQVTWNVVLCCLEKHNDRMYSAVPGFPRDYSSFNESRNQGYEN
jgi:hypothetical protein